MQTVITYQLAYLPGQVASLCAPHDDDPRFGALGPVSHGAHRGECDACRVEEGEGDDGDGPHEFSETARGYRARDRWAQRYDALNGAPEGEWDR